ncbi:MAG: hypothetical protein AB7V36_13045 [Bacteroidales bacterium]
MKEKVMDLEIVAKKLFKIYYSRGSGADCDLEEKGVYQKLSKALDEMNENKNPFYICALDICLKELVSSICINYYYISYTNLGIEYCIEENACSLETEELLSVCQRMNFFDGFHVRDDGEAIEDIKRDTNISRDVLIDIVTTIALQLIEYADIWLKQTKYNFSPEFWHHIFDAQSDEQKEEVNRFIRFVL